MGNKQQIRIPVTLDQWDKYDYSIRQRLIIQETTWLTKAVQYEPNHWVVPDELCLDIPGKDFPDDLVKSVAVGVKECPLCHGAGHVKTQEYGLKTGAYRQGRIECKCVGLKFFYTKILPTFIPTHYHDVKLSNLVPTSKSSLGFNWFNPPLDGSEFAITKAKALEVQSKEISYLQSKMIPFSPEQSFAFFGQAGSSKSTFGIAVLREHLWHHRELLQSYMSTNGVDFIWRVSAYDLMSQFHKYEIDAANSPKPVLTLEGLKACRTRGITPFVLLEELDKFTMSKFKFDTLFLILDYLTENHFPFVICSNFSLQEFEKEFEPAVFRRITEHCDVRDYHCPKELEYPEEENVKAKTQ